MSIMYRSGYRNAKCTTCERPTALIYEGKGYCEEHLPVKTMEVVHG